MANGSLPTRWLPPVGGRTNPISLRFLNESRAGVNGFLTRSGNKIVASNTGKEIKVRGIHLSQQASYLPAADSPNVAQTLADMGFNWVRFQGDDKLRSTSSAGNFWDTSAADYRTFDTTVGVDNFLTRWDQTREDFAQKGIYTEFMLSYNRPYPSAQRPAPYQSDTWPGTNSYGIGLFFMDPIKQWNKDYWTRFLKRPSAATGVPPILDPSVGMIYICNEDGLCDAWNRSSLYWSPSNLVGQLRTDLIARWSAYSNANGTGTRTELIPPSGSAWGSEVNFASQAANSQNNWMSWLMYEEAAYFQEMYNFLRGLGVQCLIMCGTSNYLVKKDIPTDCYTKHTYDNTPTAGSVTDTTNLTRSSGSNSGTVASAGTIAIGHSISGATGWPSETYVTNISGTTVTFDQAATSNGTTSTAFSSPYTLSGGTEIIASHTLGQMGFGLSQYRDLNYPYILDEFGVRFKPILGNGFIIPFGIILQKQNMNGWALFGYGSGFIYPMVMDINTNSFNGDEFNARNPSSLLSTMAMNLLLEKGYVSPLPTKSPLRQSTSTILANAVSNVSFSYGTHDLDGSTQRCLVTQVGIEYTPNASDDNSSTYVANLPAIPSMTSAPIVLGGSGVDQTTWDRSTASGNRLIHEHPKALVFHGILPTSFTSSYNNMTIEFPATLSQTCTTTSGSAVVAVTDGTAWAIGDHVIIAGVNFLASNKQHVARVADISGNNLTLVTQGGSSGVVAATCDASVGPGAVITRPQYGSFMLISLDNTNLGYGKAVMTCIGDFWPANFKVLSNTELANANLRKFPNYKNTGSNSRPYIDCPVGKITFPASVRVSSIDSDGNKTSVGRGTVISTTQAPTYLVEA